MNNNGSYLLTLQSSQKGFWKFNASLLHDSYYVNMLKPKLLEVTNKLKNVEDKRISWELTKLEIRNVTLPYCIKKEKEMYRTRKKIK